MYIKYNVIYDHLTPLIVYVYYPKNDARCIDYFEHFVYKCNKIYIYIYIYIYICDCNEWIIDTGLSICALIGTSVKFTTILCARI